MAKKLVQDVIPPEKRTIRHIPLFSRDVGKPKPASTPSKTPPKSPPKSDFIEPENPRVEPLYSLPPMTPKKPKKKSRFYIYLAIVVILVLIGFALSYVFASATVTVTPKSATAPVDSILESMAAPEVGDISHDIAVATSTQSASLQASESKQVDRKASGQITVYNNYSTASQRLIKNTRFQSPDGRIYRIDSSITVPGKKTENGQSVPGSLTVTVYADASGVDYNLALTDLKGDFTIPGFKGSAQYDGFYARLATDITGGFSGMAKVVDDASIQAAKDELQSKAKNDLWDSIQKGLPAAYILFPENFYVDYTDNSEDVGTTDTFSLTVTAVAHAVIFDKKSLSSVLAQSALSDYKGDDVSIKNIDDMQIIPKPSDSAHPWLSSPYIEEIKGNPVFVWQFDEAKLASDLSGKSKNSLGTVLGAYSAVEKASAKVSPPWMGKFPSSPEKIKIEKTI